VKARACPAPKLDWELAEQPAVGVDLAAAAAFCRWAGGRLPTADEWQRAARGDDGRLYPWGDEPPVVDDKHKANFGAAGRNTTMGNREDGHTYAAPVDVFAARGRRPFGVVNLAGNVREWTTAPGGQGAPAVMGGGWRSPSYDLRVSRREAVAPDEVANDLGFRCVKDLGADERTAPRAPDGP
jgi:formylglycine-generating enzyme required for sulfatase activity